MLDSAPEGQHEEYAPVPADFRKASVGGGKANAEGYLLEAVQLYSIRRCGLALAADMLGVDRPTVIAFSARV